MPKARPQPRPKPTGVTSTRIYNGQLTDLDQNADVRGERWIGTPDKLGVCDKMVRDPTVKRSHNSVVDTLVGAFWDFEPASTDPLDVEIAEFCEYNLFERIAWERFIERSFSYLRYGYSLHEVTADNRRIPVSKFPQLGAKGRGWGYMITDFHHRPSPSVAEWVPRKDNAAQLAAVHQWGAGSDVEDAGDHTIPGDWLFRVTWEQEGANYAGFAPSRPQHGAWKAKTICQVLRMIRHERYAVATPIITLPDGQVLTQADDEVIQAQKIAANFRSNETGYAILPGGWKLEAQNLDGDIEATIKHCDQQIMLAFGGGFELLGNNNSGSHALAGTQKQGQDVAIERHAAIFASAINLGFDGWSVVERIVRPNYGPKVMLPSMRCRALPTRNWVEVFKSIRNLGEIGFITPGRVTERFIRWVSTLPQESMPYVMEGFRARMGISPEKTPAEPEKAAA